MSCQRRNGTLGRRLGAATLLLVGAAAAFGCDHAKALGGPEQVEDCKTYIEAADACLADDKVPKHAKMGIRVKKDVLVKNWANYAMAGKVEEAKQDCREYHEEVKKVCGAS